jgi:hypothetical protein
MSTSSGNCARPGCSNPVIDPNPPLGMCSQCQKRVEQQVINRVANRKGKGQGKRIKMKIGALKFK